ncbi:hypothetical protein CUMW_084950 [Citrus unshiu]|nr:hypothetical protein CUMW_084950 [Citrus unshiu]
MSNLRLLKFYVPKFDEIEKLPSMSTEEQLSYSKVQLPNGLNYLPKKLRYLHWDTYPLRTLPSNFKPKNLVGLNLRFSKVEQLWEGEMACVPPSIQNFKYLSALSFEGCKNATNCNRLQSLPEIQSCLQELDASVLEKLSKPSPGFRKWAPRSLRSTAICFGFINCLKLNGKANNKILADSLLRIRHMAIASLRLGYEKVNNEKLSELTGSLIVLPGSEIPDWFSNQSSGSSICIQLPPHSFCRSLIGFAFCAVLDFKQAYSDCLYGFFVSCELDLEIKTPSETKHVDLGYVSRFIEDLIDSDHVMLGFKPCLNVGFPDGYHHTTVSFKFFAKCNRKSHEIKRYGVCPVYANPSETKANTVTLNFATEVWKLDDLPSASGTAASEFDSSSDEGEFYCIDSSSDEGELYYSFDEEELEPSP